MTNRILLVISILLISGNLAAGQLHVDYITLVDVAKWGQIIMLGTVVSIDAAKNKVQAKIKRYWRKEDTGNIVNVNDVDSPKNIQELRIYSGIVWTDPNKSPMDRRVMGAISVSEIKLGQDVIFIPNMGYEMLPAKAETMEKLDLLYSPSSLAEYKTSAPAEKLYHDLKDNDMSAMALDTMCERNLLAPEAFLAVEDWRMFQFGWEMRNKLSDEKYDAWFLSMVHAVQSMRQKIRLVDLARETLVAPKIRRSTYLTLLRSLDLADPDQSRYIEYFISEESDEIKKHPESLRVETAEIAINFALALMEKSKSIDSRQTDSLSTLLTAFPKEKRIVVIRKIGSLVMTSQSAMQSNYKFDENLFDYFLKMVRAVPSLEYLPEFTKINIATIPDTSQAKVENYSTLLDVAWFLAQSFPDHKLAIRTTFARWAVDGKLFSPDIIMSIDAESPEKKRIRWQESLNKFKSLAN